MVNESDQTNVTLRRGFKAATNPKKIAFWPADPPDKFQTPGTDFS